MPLLTLWDTKEKQGMVF